MRCHVAGPAFVLICLATAAHAIVGPSSEAPALAASVLMVLRSAGRVAGFCSGVVIAPRVVLTAAHCAPRGSDLRIHYKEPDGKPVLSPVAAVARNSGYRADAIRSRERSIDLALLRLPADLPDRFRAARLGQTASTAAGTPFRVAGYGVAREGDAASSGVLRVATLRARAPLSSLLLWAEDPSHRGAGACTGDSGGPVLDETTDQVEAITLWSAGEAADACGAVTQAIWLGPQRPWIAKILAGWGMTLPQP